MDCEKGPDVNNGSPHGMTRLDRTNKRGQEGKEEEEWRITDLTNGGFRDCGSRWAVEPRTIGNGMAVCHLPSL